jgi:hypothetical protein
MNWIMVIAIAGSISTVGGMHIHDATQAQCMSVKAELERVSRGAVTVGCFGPEGQVGK